MDGIGRILGKWSRLIGCALVVVGWCCSSALAEGASFSGFAGAYRESPFVVAGMQWLTGDEQPQARRAADLSNPVAIDARQASRSEFAGLDAGGAAKLALAAFPNVIGRPVGGLPPLPAGARVLDYRSDNVAQLALPGGRRGLVESSTPIAATSSGHAHMPIDLGLRNAGAAFAPARSDVALRIPRKLWQGASLTSLGVSMTPVDGQGRPLHGGEGHVDGASVFYAATGSDSDNIVKPTASGLQVDTLLRAQDSPQRLYFHMGLPHGAHLAQKSRRGAVQVRRANRTLAVVRPPSAQDADGTPVGVSMKASGSTLVLSVDHRTGDYRYPIEVDPEVGDSELNGPTNWHFVHSAGGTAFTASENSGGKGWTEHISGSHTALEYGALEYTTQGHSYIYLAKIEGRWHDTGAHIENLLEIVPPSKTPEGKVILPVDTKGYEEESFGGAYSQFVCEPEPSCRESGHGKGAYNNTVTYLQESTGPGGGVSGENQLTGASVYLAQEESPTISFDTTHETLEGRQNVLYGAGGWLGPHSGAFEIHATDPGLGISMLRVLTSGYADIHNYLWNGECAGAQCLPTRNKSYVYQSSMKDGEDSFEALDEDAVGLIAHIYPQVVKVDSLAPHGVTLTGLPSGNELGAGEYHLQAEASDGSGATPSAGIKSISLAVDGQQVGAPSGSCSPGPCTARSGEWTISGRSFAGGQHVLSVIAEDRAGNVETHEYTIIVRQASPVPLGPGSLSPESGEYGLDATDVSMGGGLTVSRSYLSEHLTAGVGGPLGAQWGIDMTSSAEYLEKQPNGSVVLSDASGERAIFPSDGKGGFTSPTGDANLALSEKETSGVKEYVLANAAKGASTHFTLPSGGGVQWMPTIQEGTAPTETLTYAYETVEVAGHKITRPVQALAPVPSEVSCKPTLTRGCRALTFNYATSTTATGENESEWGDYQGNLTRVYYTAYEPTSGTMVTTTVAQYTYDAHGRLRAEWDPRISPLLKTKYGYDSEGHLTALTPPGQETTVFTYGQSVGDHNTGRMLRIINPPATTALWGGKAPVNTAAPALSSEEPAPGTAVSVSTGTWSNAPVGFAYQWQRCNPAGGECTAILGALNETYTPTLSDVGHTLRTEVRASNGDGTVAAYTIAQKLSTVPRLLYNSQFGSFGTGNAHFKYPEAAAVDSSGDVWVSDTENNRMQEFSASGEYLRQFGTVGTGNGQFKEPSGVAMTSSGNMWVADAGNARVQEFSATGAYIAQFGSPGTGPGQFTRPAGVAVCPSGNIWVADTSVDRVKEFTSTGTYIREVGATGAGNAQFYDPAGVACDAASDVWVADSGNDRVQELSPTGTYMFQFGALGKGNGQFEEPEGITVDTVGTIWVTDRYNNRIQGFTAGGSYLAQYGPSSGEHKLLEPYGITATSSGSLYVVDTSNHRIQKLTIVPVSPPLYNSQFGSFGTGNGNLKYPRAAAVDSSGDVWVADGENNRMQEFSATGEYLRQFGTVGTGNGQFKEPWGVAMTPGGNMWVADAGNARVQEFSSTGAYIAQFGSSGTGPGQFVEPAGVAVCPSGNIWVADARFYRVKEFTSTGAFIREVGGSGTGNAQFAGPSGVACDAANDVWAVDSGNDRVQELSPTGAYMFQFGSLGKGNGQLEEPQGITIDPAGTIWVTERFNNRIQGFTAGGSYLTQYGPSSGEHKLLEPRGITVTSSGALDVVDSGNDRIQKLTLPESTSEPATPPNPGETSQTTVEYNVPVSGSGAPQKMGAGEVAAWGQTDDPVQATAIFPPDRPEGWPAPESAYGRATIYYLDAKGRTVNEARPTGGIATTEYNETNDAVRSLSADNRAAALAEGGKSAEASKLLDTQSTYNSEGTELQSTLGPRHKVKLASGEEVLARHHLVYSYNEGEPETGGPYRLVTKTAGGAQVEGKSEQDVRTTTTSYSGQGNLGWKLRKPTSVTNDPSGLKLTHTTVYDSTSGNVTETRTPGSSGEGDPRDTKTVYYSSGSNSSFPSCGSHPEWVGLACETLPGAQPETSGVPNLPVTTVTYNTWSEPAKVTMTVGSSTRTTTMTYDAAGRPKKSAISSSVGTALPTVTNYYSESSGLLAEQSAIIEGKEQTLRHVYNVLGQLTSYKDADATTSTFEYDIDGRVTKVNDGKGTQTYTYDATTGLETQLVDSNAGTFTASYDVEGNLLTEKYPNVMNANHTYNAAGEATGIEYLKTSNCTTECQWFTENLARSIHGQALSQASSLAQDAYSYDADGRLTQVQETPQGAGCVTRVYGYDKETNRTGLTSREPGSEGHCATEGGTTVTHTYDTANRLTDAGVSYDAFGNTTALPAADAGGSELTSTFYDDNRVASQTQAGETIGYQLDPSRRTRETVSTGHTTASVVYHYAGDGDSPSWTYEASGKWTRNIHGIGGGLVAIENNGESATLQLSDLNGNMVATASTSNTAKHPLTTTRNTEFGVPTVEAPAKYSWLGADERATELPSGVIAMGARSYVPQLGRFLQTDPRPGGSANAYGYTNGDPVNTTDLTGEYVENDYMMGFYEAENFRAIEREAAREQAAREEAERLAAQAASEVIGSETYQGPGNEGSAGGVLSENGGEASASRYFDRTWLLPSIAATALGRTILASGSDVGEYVLGLIHIPSWIHRVFDDAFAGRLDEFANELIAAAAKSGGGTVEVEIYGSFATRMSWTIRWYDF
ncbi:MAG: RHS repeat-associated core domain-containing protein [Solirubrobacteraceae bacterium]